LLHNSVTSERQRDELASRSIPSSLSMRVDNLRPALSRLQYNLKSIGPPCPKPAPLFLAHAGILRCRPCAWFGRHHGSRPERNPVLHRRCLFSRSNDLKSARFEDVKADVLIMETTPQSRSAAGFTREGEIERLQSGPPPRARTQSLRPDSDLRPRTHAGNPGAIAVLMREGKLQRQPIYIGGLGRVSPRLRFGIAPHAPAIIPTFSCAEALNLSCSNTARPRK